MCEKSARDVIKSLQKELDAARMEIELLREKNEELERLSITDELTGLYNQRHFHNKLEQEVVRSKEERHPLCVIFFDVDGLKTYNDTYGHLGGNDVLKAVASSLSHSIRNDMDSGFRYGGDEFAAILREVYAEQAVEIARRINIHLRKVMSQNVALSFGVAELRPEMDSMALFRHADEAMYVAKKGTKDRIHVYDSE